MIIFVKALLLVLPIWFHSGSASNDVTITVQTRDVDPGVSVGFEFGKNPDPDPHLKQGQGLSLTHIYFLDFHTNISFKRKKSLYFIMSGPDPVFLMGRIQIRIRFLFTVGLGYVFFLHGRIRINYTQFSINGSN